jgi:hypothetical protein
LQESGLGRRLRLPPPESAIVIRPFRMNITYFVLWEVFAASHSSLA